MKYTALAFASPLIASFALDGVASAAPRPGLGQQKHHFPNQQCPNQHFPNQHWPNQHWPNQCGPGGRPWYGFEGGEHP